jgi:hypothetical protein
MSIALQPELEREILEFVQLCNLKLIVCTYTSAKLANPHGGMVNVGGCE